MGTNVANINKSPLAAFANQYDIDPLEMERTLKQTVFRQPANYKTGEVQEVTNAQMLMLMTVAKEHNLNPFKKEIYAFPSQGGIVAMVPIDGWLNIINSHPEYDGMEFNESDEWEDRASSQSCPKWIECLIYRKDRSRPTRIKEYFDETYRDTAPWNISTKRMLRHKAIIQCARVAFSLGGIFDEDEAPEIAMHQTKTVNEIPDGGVEKPQPKVADKPTSQSRTEEIMKRQGVKDKAEKPEKTQDAEPVQEVKQLTTQKKTALLKKIEESETPDALHELATEFAQFEKTDPLLIPIRTAWKDKMATLQKQ